MLLYIYNVYKDKKLKVLAFRLKKHQVMHDDSLVENVYTF